MRPAGNHAFAGAAIAAASAVAANIVVQPPLLAAVGLVVIFTGVAFLVCWMLEQRPGCGHHFWSAACVALQHDQCTDRCRCCGERCTCGCHWQAAR